MYYLYDEDVTGEQLEKEKWDDYNDDILSGLQE